MRFYVPLAAALLAMTAGNCQADTVIPAEIPTAVELSNMDINRIVCSGTMTDLIFSQEKGMTGHFSGNNAFIKFKIEDMGGEYIYADEQSELFVVCNNTVYNLIVTPTDIPSVTIRLASPKGDSFRKNIAHYKNLPLEKQALQIIREAYDGTYPSSYRVSEPAKVETLSPDVEVTLTQVVDVDGVGLRLKKYVVKSLVQEPVTLNEKLFLSSSVSGSILAVAIEDHNLDPGQTTSVFVVDQKEQPQ
jgi:conjugal transfer pilus assembly protein TraK